METLVLEKPSAYEIERNKPTPSKFHSKVQANIVFELTLHYEQQYDTFSELTLEFTEGDIVPDICLFQKGVLSFAEEEIRVSVPPVLAIEILSPTQSLHELLTKAGKYFQNGVLSYWLVIPLLRSIHVFSSANEYEVYKKKDILQDNASGISIDLGKVFPS
ncbi:MAG: Uma2 family endonuclease [Bacteroidetes bacterium]|nr:MAG: Uma2 family endonuclease [Bacteroidota bacterium]